MTVSGASHSAAALHQVLRAAWGEPRPRPRCLGGPDHQEPPPARQPTPHSALDLTVLGPPVVASTASHGTQLTRNASSTKCPDQDVVLRPPRVGARPGVAASRARTVIMATGSPRGLASSRAEGPGSAVSLMAPSHGHSGVPAGSPSVGRKLGERQAAPYHQPRDHRVRVPHLTGAQLVATPGQHRYRPQQPEQPAHRRGMSVRRCGLATASAMSGMAPSGQQRSS